MKDIQVAMAAIHGSGVTDAISYAGLAQFAFGIDRPSRAMIASVGRAVGVASRWSIVEIENDPADGRRNWVVPSHWLRLNLEIVRARSEFPPVEDSRARGSVDRLQEIDPSGLRLRSNVFTGSVFGTQAVTSFVVAGLLLTPRSPDQTIFAARCEAWRWVLIDDREEDLVEVILDSEDRAVFRLPVKRIVRGRRRFPQLPIIGSIPCRVLELGPRNDLSPAAIISTHPIEAVGGASRFRVELSALEPGPC
jgi:hypothetical protein